MNVVSRVRSGIIHINDQGIGDEPMAPFGGVQNSGYGKFGGTVRLAVFTTEMPGDLPRKDQRAKGERFARR